MFRDQGAASYLDMEYQRGITIIFLFVEKVSLGHCEAGKTISIEVITHTFHACHKMAWDAPLQYFMGMREIREVGIRGKRRR